MSHVEGRGRLVARCADRPIAHVAAEMGISRACASKLRIVTYRPPHPSGVLAEAGLAREPSRPHNHHRVDRPQHVFLQQPGESAEPPRS